MAGFSANQPRQAGSWIAAPRANPSARLRLFCLPYSGATASVFYPWIETLPAAIELNAVQLPGRGPRVHEDSFTSLTELVAALSTALEPYLDRPFAIFGHSMGALVGFELCRSLSRQGLPLPVHFFASGHAAPQLEDDLEPIYNLPETVFRERIRTLNGTPEEVFQNEELLDLVMPILRADFTVCDTYQYRPSMRLNVPITAMSGLQDRYVTREMMDAWREQTSRAFSLRLFPGDHFYLNTARPYVLQVLARELSAYLSTSVDGMRRGF